jgi:hypothetical protein
LCGRNKAEGNGVAPLCGNSQSLKSRDCGRIACSVDVLEHQPITVRSDNDAPPRPALFLMHVSDFCRADETMKIDIL